MRGIEKLKTGDFNYMRWEKHADGSILVTLTKRGEREIYRFRVKDLYLPTEEVLSEEVIERG